MGEKKEQKIIVFITFTPNDKNLILNGIKLASIFRKELCLTCHLKKNQYKRIHQFKKKLIDYTLPVNKEIPALKTSVVLLQERMQMIPQVLADDHEAIMLVADSLHYKIFAKAMITSPVPILFVNGQTPVSSFKKIILPVDLRKGNSDCALWCSWFGKYNHSEITVIAAQDKNKDAQKRVTHNILTAKRLFQKLQITHQIYKGTKNSLQNSFETRDFAESNHFNLLVLLGSSLITPLDWLLGLPEKKIIKNSSLLPVLLINSRRDNYMLCE
ncbi:MAG: hypothetical protein PHV35_05140 [Mariniphaga sp.]|nr:hypothetical protein [Mariniphaga sp.]